MFKVGENSTLKEFRWGSSSVEVTDIKLFDKVCKVLANDLVINTLDMDDEFGYTVVSACLDLENSLSLVVFGGSASDYESTKAMDMVFILYTIEDMGNRVFISHEETDVDAVEEFLQALDTQLFAQIESALTEFQSN